MNPPDKQFWMQQALDQARMAEMAGEVPVGAIIVYNDQHLASGQNRCIRDHDPSAHAEIISMRQAGQIQNNYRLSGCTLYVTLEPCAMCLTAAIHARLDRLVYAASDPKTGAAGGAFDLLSTATFNHHLAVEQGPLQADCAAQLKHFFRQRRHAQPTTNHGRLV